MRVNAADTGLNRFIANPLARQGAAAKTPFGKPSIMDGTQFSKFSGRLVIDGQAVTAWDKCLTNADDEKAVQLMDQSISNIGNIMERMKSLTELATDKSLSDEDRIDIQIDLVKLNKNLNVEKQRMSLRMAGQSEKEIADNLNGLEGSAKWAIEMLERARERVLNGEEWDVAEVYQQEYKLSSVEVQTPEGRQFFEEGENFKLPVDIDPKTAKIVNHLAPDGGSMVLTDDPNAPKVSTLLAGIGMPMVMDAQSAKDTLPKINAQLKDLMALKEELVGVVHESRMEWFEAEQNGTSQLLESLEPTQDSSADLDDKKKELTVQTSIGEMVYSDGDTSHPVLRNPQNAAGKMFAKLAKFFSSRIGNFSETLIRDNGTFAATFSSALPKINGMGDRKPQTVN